MEKNLEKCPHCEQRLIRLGEKTPLINRTDGENFHLTLFSGPYRRSVRAGDIHSESLVCAFVYVHDRIGPNNEHVTVTIAKAERTEDGAFKQVNALADELAELIARGERLDHDYRFDQGQLEAAKG